MVVVMLIAVEVVGLVLAIEKVVIAVMVGMVNMMTMVAANDGNSSGVCRNGCSGHTRGILETQITKAGELAAPRTLCRG